MGRLWKKTGRVWELTSRCKHLHLAVLAIEDEGKAAAIGQTERQGLFPCGRTVGLTRTLPEGIAQAVATGHDDGLTGLTNLKGWSYIGSTMLQQPPTTDGIGDIRLIAERCAMQINALHRTTDIALLQMATTKCLLQQCHDITTRGCH